MARPGAPLLDLEDTAALPPATSRRRVRVRRIVRAGQPVEVRLDARVRTRRRLARRSAKSARLDPASHSFLVKIDLPTTPALRSGLFGRARFAGANGGRSPCRRVGHRPPRPADASSSWPRTLARRAPSSRRRPARAAGDRVEILAGLSRGRSGRSSLHRRALTDGARVSGGGR